MWRSKEKLSAPQRAGKKAVGELVRQEGLWVAGAWLLITSRVAHLHR